MSNTTWKCDNCGFEKNTGNFCGMCGSARMQRKEGRLQKLTCEMCGGNDIVKENGLYVCQHCGTKYSVEEAKQLFIKGTVKIDNSQKVDNLYQLAHRSLKEHDFEQAQKYYEQILLEQPDDWEAVFYSAYCKFIGCKVEDIKDNAEIFLNKLETTFLLLKTENEEDKEKILGIITFFVIHLVDTLEGKILDKSYDDAIASTNDRNFDYDEKDLEETWRYESLVEVLDVVINRLAPYTANKTLVEYKFSVQKKVVHIQSLMYNNRYADKKKIRSRLEKEQAEIAAYDPNYKIEKLSHCYIATAVYGSYDCPQVWVLRRFRDEVLTPTQYGNFFVKTYYAVSPKLLQLVGDTKVFRKICISVLDKFVCYLQRRGFSDKPYEDK